MSGILLHPDVAVPDGAAERHMPMRLCVQHTLQKPGIVHADLRFCVNNIALIVHHRRTQTVAGAGQNIPPVPADWKEDSEAAGYNKLVVPLHVDEKALRGKSGKVRAVAELSLYDDNYGLWGAGVHQRSEDRYSLQKLGYCAHRLSRDLQDCLPWRSPEGEFPKAERETKKGVTWRIPEIHMSLITLRDDFVQSPRR